MTLADDWAVKPQRKQTELKESMQNCNKTEYLTKLITPIPTYEEKGRKKNEQYFGRLNLA